MNYKLSIAQKVIAKLLHEIFSGKLLQNIAPVKHGNLHFATLNAIDKFLRIKMFAFALVDYVKKGEKKLVAGKGIEPLTRGFSVPCSTN